MTATRAYAWPRVSVVIINAGMAAALITPTYLDQEETTHD